MTAGSARQRWEGRRRGSSVSSLSFLSCSAGVRCGKSRGIDTLEVDTDSDGEEYRASEKESETGRGSMEKRAGRGLAWVWFHSWLP